MKIDGTHVLVTGATRGIGLATAREFRRRGAKLSVLARDSEQLTAVASELGAYRVPVDLRDLDAVCGVLDDAEGANGPLDVLVNNAAMMGMGALPKLPPQTYREVLTVNLLATTELARSAAARMAPRRTGAIVTVSSLVGEMAVRGVGLYSTSKVAIAHFTRILERELRGTGVRPHLVFLGAVDTELIRENKADPVAGPAAARLSMIPADEPDTVAVRLVDMVESGRRRPLVMPPAGAPTVMLRNIPTRLADLLLAGLPRSMP